MGRAVFNHEVSAGGHGAGVFIDIECVAEIHWAVRHGVEPRRIVKHFVAEIFQSVRNGDIGQTGAAIECSPMDVFHAVGDVNTR